MSVAVSIIIPVFNRLHCCKDALRILKAQTLKNIEFIIVDDGSTDGGYEYLVKNTRADKRFKIKKLEKNSGPSVARNIALGCATGDFVGFFDVDDSVPKDYFEKLYKAACDNNADIVFATYNNLKHVKTGLFQKLSDKIAGLRNGSACDKLFKRDLIADNNISFPDGMYCADNVFVFKTFFYAKNVVVCNEPVYKYTLSVDSISCDETKAVKRKSDILKVIDCLLDFVKQNNFDNAAKEETYYFLRRTFNRYPADSQFNLEVRKKLSGLKSENYENGDNKQKGNNAMFWLKLKKHLGLIGNEKFEKLILMSKILQSGLFDEQYYLRKYPDVQQANMNPIEHYLLHGWEEGRNPSTRFNSNAYLSDNPDVASAGICPLVHYIDYGMAEGRFVRTLPADNVNSTIDSQVYKTLKKSKLFNEKWYLNTYTDVKHASINPVEHYIRYGAGEGRNPSRFFDTRAYLNRYVDVKNAGINPLFHYIKYGAAEGRIVQGLDGKVRTEKRSFKQKIRYAWEYPVRVHDEYLRLKEEIKKLKNSK